LFGALKVERLHGQRLTSRHHAKDEVVGRILWYSRSRLHSTLRDTEFEGKVGPLNQQARAAPAP